MNIVCFGSQNWEVCSRSMQPLLGRMAARGHRVLFIDPQEAGPPLGFTGFALPWHRRCQVRQIQDGLHVLTLRPPGPSGGLLRRRTVARAAEELGLWAPVTICFSQTPQPLLDAVEPAARLLLLEPDVALPDDDDAQRMLEGCDLAVVLTRAQFERARRLLPHTLLHEDGGILEPPGPPSRELEPWHRRADRLEEWLTEAQRLAAERRSRQRLPAPRPDRHGRQVVRIEPRLDGKDGSVRLLHDNYIYNGLSQQQHALYLLSRGIGMAYYLLRRAGRLLRGDREAVRRILVVRNGHLGDTVVFLPTLAALRSRYPGARITVVLAPGSGARPLLEASPFVDEVLALDFFNRSRRDRFIGAARLLARGFDLAVGGVWYFHLPEAVFSGAPLRLGLYDGHPLQRYADRVMMLDPNLHEAESNLRLVELVTGPAPEAMRVPRLKLDEDQLTSRAAQMREALQIPEGAAVLAMHPGSKRPSRRWPAERFAELAEELLQERPQLHVVFTGAGGEEQELIESVRAMVPEPLRRRTHNAVGVADLVGVIGFYDLCRLLVCNDTGVMHVARARGVPLVAIIGPENDRRWGPHPMGPAPAVAVRQQVPGTPHGKWQCDWNLSLQSIDAARIKRHVDAMLDGAFGRFDPVEVDGQVLYPLVRDVRRLSFSQLLELGIDLPQVAVVLAADPALLGGDASPLEPAALEAAAGEIRRQLYPCIQTLLVTADPGQLSGMDLAPAQVVAVPEGDPDSAWAAALACTEAPLIWPATAGPHPPGTVSNRVGVFLRGPHACVVDGQRAWPMRTLINADLLSGQWMVTRQCLEEILAHPLPAARRVDAHVELELELVPA